MLYAACLMYCNINLCPNTYIHLVCHRICIGINVVVIDVVVGNVYPVVFQSAVVT